MAERETSPARAADNTVQHDTGTAQPLFSDEQLARLRATFGATETPTPPPAGTSEGWGGNTPTRLMHEQLGGMVHTQGDCPTGSNPPPSRTGRGTEVPGDVTPSYSRPDTGPCTVHATHPARSGKHGVPPLPSQRASETTSRQVHTHITC